MAMIVGMMLTAVGVALLSKVLKDGIWPQINSTKGKGESRGRILEIDEYEIVDDTQNRESEGYRIRIDD